MPLYAEPKIYTIKKPGCLSIKRAFPKLYILKDLPSYQKIEYRTTNIIIIA